MATYRTGRMRTLRYEATVAGRHHTEMYSVNPAMTEEDPYIPYAYSTFSMSIFGASISGSNGAIDPEYPTPELYAMPPGPGVLGYHVVVDTGLGDLERDDVFVTHFFNVPPDYVPFIYDANPEGTAWIELDVEEIVDITGSGWPSYGGPPTPDAPPEVEIRFAERARIGGSLRVHVEWGDAEVGVETEITELNQFTVSDYTCSFAATAGGANNSSHMRIANARFGSPGEEMIGLGAPGFELSAGIHSANATGGAVAQVVAGPFQSGYVNTTANLSPPRSYEANGTVRAMDGGYPGTVTLLADRYASGGTAFPLHAGSGGFTDSYTQRRFSASASFSGSLQSPPGEYEDKNEWHDYRLRLDPEWLEEVEEDPDDWRVLLRGWAFHSFTMEHLAHVVVDGGDSLTPGSGPAAGAWDDGSHTTASVSGGAIQAVVSGGAGSLVRSFTAPCNFAAYRHLQLRVRSQSAGVQPLRLTLLTEGSITKHWDLVTHDDPGEWVVRTVDLCVPHDENALTDNCDTQWPFPTVDGPYFGVSHVETLTLSNLADGETYQVDWLRLVRPAPEDEADPVDPDDPEFEPLSDVATLTFLPAFKHWELRHQPVVISESGTVSTTKVRRFVLGDTNGRQSMEQDDLFWVHTLGGGTGIETNNYTMLTLAQLFESMTSDHHWGWVGTEATFDLEECAVDTPLLRRCYLNNSLPAVFAMGAGARYTWEPEAEAPGAGTAGAPPSWRWGFDLDARDTEGGLAVYAQVLCDRVGWYPGIGDAWGWEQGDYGGPAGPFRIRGAKIMRGQAHGLVLAADPATSQVPVEDAVVRVRESPGDDASRWAGDGVSGVVGAYQTGAPYGRGQVQHKIRPLGRSGTAHVVTADFLSRKRHRACFRSEPPCEVLMADGIHFPFASQWGDPELVPVEEWRRVPSAGGDRRKGAQESSDVSGPARDTRDAE